MDRRMLGLAALVAAGAVGYLVVTSPAPAPNKAPAPNVQPAPKPKCPDCPDGCPAPEPKRPRRPWAGHEGAVGAHRGCCGQDFGNPEPAIDLLACPSQHRPHNVGGRDGAGLCVFTSIQYASWWQNEPRLKRFQQQMRAEPGGGYPQKVTKMIGKYGPGTRYVQYEGRDPAIIELALKTGRLPCITWNANHMLNCVALTSEQGAIVDNNSPNRVQWFSRSEFLRKWTAGGGGWVVVLLSNAPAPAPKSRLPKLIQGGERIDESGCVCGPSCIHCKGDPCDPACGDPCRCIAKARAAGQDGERLHEPAVEVPGGVVGWVVPDAPRYQLNGRASSWGEVAEALVDDTAKLHLTAVGPKEFTGPLLAGLGAHLERYSVQAYEPDAWELACGFVNRPCVYLQARDGTVLLRRDNPKDAAEVVGALRRTDPNYHPDGDPSGQPSAPSASGVIDWAKNNPGASALLALLGAGGAWFGLGGKQKQQAQAAPVPARGQAPAQPKQAHGVAGLDLDAIARELGRRELARQMRDMLGRGEPQHDDRVKPEGKP